MINPIHLRTLTTVVERGSFAAAGRDLGYTSSAVSQQVAHLERITGLTLFERDSRRARPTEAAVSLVRHSAEALLALDTLEAQLPRLRTGHTSTLRLGTFPTASAAVMPLALAHLAASHPDARVELDEDEPVALVSRLMTSQLDLALIYEYDLVPQRWPPGMDCIPVLVEDMVMARSPGQVTHALSGMSDARWISTLDGSAGDLFLHRQCALAGFEPQVPWRSNDYDVVRGLVAAGLGTALVPALATIGWNDAADLDQPEDVRGHRRVWIVRRRAACHPLAATVIDSLHSAARALTRRHRRVHRPR
ncbi:LysR family transcriptional regulator [Aeromicrobium fastidiosum]|uniref:LysR family transcriptional regulator n=1 Tax=Aeromicrobium fastidiosum TaxID=52699 RepID=A0A641APZ6_9ACTN|nr:LysR family transcriptional regulator [Aeromicrobium fastidiosum]KAA1378467.1 LysR family transcriptional regulator [Aeromicrobium fastidiosum]MBP2392568.1 DNA-binding transcriptional LysR family regulator [Aeromicrobium fastidiosum]